MTIAANAPVVLQARGLRKQYGHVVALDGADFDVRAGEILAVIGDNGAGKSSLIKVLSGAKYAVAAWPVRCSAASIVPACSAKPLTPSRPSA